MRKGKRPSRHIRGVRVGRGRSRIRRRLINPHIKKRIRKTYGSTFEIKLVHPKYGRKTKLLLLREDLEENLRVPDIQKERKTELQERLENVNQQLERIQGQPPIELVRGKTPSILKLELLQRYKGTSSRRPAFVEELNLPLTEDIPKNKERLRKSAMENFGIKKGLDILSEKSLAEVAKGKEPSQISLKDLRKHQRLNFGSTVIGRIIDKSQEEESYTEPVLFFKGNELEIRKTSPVKGPTSKNINLAFHKAKETGNEETMAHFRKGAEMRRSFKQLMKEQLKSPTLHLHGMTIEKKPSEQSVKDFIDSLEKSENEFKRKR